MQKQFDRSKPFLTIGTMGHVDNGKTTTTSVISLYLSLKYPDLNTSFKSFDQIDKAPEEKKRGITINSTFISYQTPNRQYGHVDCPGHADYVKNMITGATQMDGAILVISAPAGLGVQDKEHIRLSKTIGIKHLVVFINKCDQVEDKELLELCEMEVLEFLTEQGFPDDTPFIYGSALKASEDLANKQTESDTPYGVNTIAELMEKVDSYIPLPAKDLDGDFLLPVEDIFTVPGRGTAVAGRIYRGKVNLNDEIRLINFGKDIKTTVTSIETFNQSMDHAEANENPALLIRGVGRDEVERGLMCVKSNFKFQQYTECEIDVYLLTKDEGGRNKPVSSKYEPQAFISTANVTTTWSLVGTDLLLPGDSGKVNITLHKSMFLEVGMRISFREGGHTIANGLITKIHK